MAKNKKSDYDKWLDEIEENDTEENREWYNLEDKERSDWLRKHPDFGSQQGLGGLELNDDEKELYS